MTEVPEIDLSDPAVLRDLAAAYAPVREKSPVARLLVPGLGRLWAVTRYEEARAALADPRLRSTRAASCVPTCPSTASGTCARCPR